MSSTIYLTYVKDLQNYIKFEICFLILFDFTIIHVWDSQKETLGGYYIY